jgi:ABC-2 type transport system permease protein
VSALGVILRARARATWNTIVGLRDQSQLKIAVIVLVGGGLWAGLFAASFRSLHFLSRYEELREDIIFTTFSLMFMALSILLTFSSAILSFGTLFRTPETTFLLATPVPAGSVYAYKTFEGLVFSSWAFLVMGLPPMLAYGIDVGAPALYYIGLPLFFIPFALMTSAAGTLAGLVLTGLAPRHRGKMMAVAAVVVVLIGVVLVYRVVASGHTGVGTVEIWKEQVLGHLSFLRNRYLPHSWLTRGLLLLAAGRAADIFVPFSAAVCSAGFAYLLGDFTARRTYSAAWSAAAGGTRRREFRPGLVARAAETLARPAGRTTSLFVSKDMRVFLRDPAQWSQVAIFFGLLAIYIVNLRNLRFDFEKPFWVHLISTLNLAAMSLTLATLTTRFVFPQMSLEGKRFWVLGLAPARRREILYGKYAFSAGGALVIAETLVVLSNVMLRMPTEVFVVHAVSVVLVCAGLTGLAAGMGALFPSYGETNPSRVVSGFGGTLTLILSVAFVAVIVGLVSVLSYYRLVDASLGPRSFKRWATALVAFAAVATAVAAGGPLVWGARKLERAEF